MGRVRKRTKPVEDKPQGRVRKRKAAKKVVRRAKAKPIQGDAVPKQWPNGSGFMRSPGQKGYKNVPMHPGSPLEDNPNLLGRIVREPDGRCSCYRWMPRDRVYVFKGIAKSHVDAFGIIKGPGYV